MIYYSNPFCSVARSAKVIVLFNNNWEKGVCVVRTVSVNHQSCCQLVEMMLRAGPETPVLPQISSWFPESSFQDVRSALLSGGQVQVPASQEWLWGSWRALAGLTTKPIAQCCPAQGSRQKMNFQQWAARCCQVGLLWDAAQLSHWTSLWHWAQLSHTPQGLCSGNNAGGEQSWVSSC